MWGETGQGQTTGLGVGRGGSRIFAAHTVLTPPEQCEGSHYCAPWAGEGAWQAGCPHKGKQGGLR